MCVCGGKVLFEAKSGILPAVAFVVPSVLETVARWPFSWESPSLVPPVDQEPGPQPFGSTSRIP